MMLRTIALLAQSAAPAEDVPLEAATEVEESLRWLGLPPAWVVALVVVPLLVGYVAWFYRREHPIGSPAWRWALGALRFVVIALALLMLAQPVRHKTTYERTDSTLLVLVDDSLSMDIADRYADRSIPQKIAEGLRSSVESVEATTRYELVRRLLADRDGQFIEALRQKGKVSVATFAKAVRQVGQADKAEVTSEGPRPDERGDGESEAESAGGAAVSLPSYSELRNDPRVQETRIAEALRDGVAGVLGAGFGRRQERVSGVLLFSDGQQNADSVSAVDIARRLGERGTPVVCVGVGNPDEPKDVRVENLDVNEVVLVDDTVPFDVSIVADGFEGQEVRVELVFDSTVVDTEVVTLGASGQRQSVRLEHQPRRPGKFNVTVQVAELPGEVFYDNNSTSKSITVLDQKIRVLYAEYLPRWEYRYLKNALIRDETMEASIFLFSADPEFTQDSSAGVTPLRRFPSTREEIFKFHVVVLGDVSPEEHLGAEVIGILKEFVLEGGGVVFLSGPHSSPRAYLHTELYPLLPVEVAELRGGAAARAPITEPFNVVLSAVGREHPVLRLDNDPERNAALWENRDGQFYDHLPGFFWFAETKRAKASAVVLARHPERGSAEDPRGFPIFAFMNYGKGMTFFSAVDNTWRWRAGVDNLFFYRFWGQVCRFVATGRLLGDTPRFSISTDKVVYAIGEPVRIEGRVYDSTMKPSVEPTVTVYHQVQGREDAPPDRVELALDEVAGPGVYRGTLDAVLRGRHDVWIGTESERSAFTSFQVEVPALESRDTRLQRALLRQIATSSGGTYLDFADAAQSIERLEGSSRSEAGLVENDDLWDEWWVVVLLTSVLALEWVLRKTVRLV